MVDGCLDVTLPEPEKEAVLATGNEAGLEGKTAILSLELQAKLEWHIIIEVVTRW